MVTLPGIIALEAEWVGRVAVTEPGKYFDWQPADPQLFMALLEACLPHVPPGNRTFLDVGCGIGTKCLLAARAGLQAYGFDRVPEYVEQAIALGVDAEVALAEDYDGYAWPGLVYVNHPLKPGSEDEEQLEQRVHDAMASGAVLLAVNYALAPPWPEVARAGEWNAAWVKP